MSLSAPLRGSVAPLSLEMNSLNLATNIPDLVISGSDASSGSIFESLDYERVDSKWVIAIQHMHALDAKGREERMKYIHHTSRPPQRCYLCRLQRSHRASQTQVDDDEHETIKWLICALIGVGTGICSFLIARKTRTKRCFARHTVVSHSTSL